MNEPPVKSPISNSTGTLSKMWRNWFTSIHTESKFLKLPMRTATPADPPAGNAVLWIDSNNNLMVKITSLGGETKSTKIVDYNTL